jgi:hypothetical protein
MVDRTTGRRYAVARCTREYGFAPVQNPVDATAAVLPPPGETKLHSLGEWSPADTGQDRKCGSESKRPGRSIDERGPCEDDASPLERLPLEAVMSARPPGPRVKIPSNETSESASEPAVPPNPPTLPGPPRLPRPLSDDPRRRLEPPTGRSNPLAGRRSCAGCASPIADSSALILCWGCGRPLCASCYWSRVPEAALHRCPSCIGRESSAGASSISGGRSSINASKVSFGAGRIR